MSLKINKDMFDIGNLLKIYSKNKVNKHMDPIFLQLNKNKI